MKRLFTLLFAVVMMAMSAMATDYTDNLQVSVDGGATKTVKDVKISVTKQENGKYKFELKDFKFSVLDIGDVVLENVEGTENDGITTLSVSEVNTIVQNPGVFGKTINFLGGITISMTAKLSASNNKMFADMTMKAASQNIKAIYGDEKNITTGISNLPVNDSNDKVELYNLQGQRISEAKPGQVVIVKKGGKAVKVVK